MASESVATYPEAYDADPVHGNFTTDAETHLWCANALCKLVVTPAVSLGEMNDDIQEAIRYLLSCEISRAKQAATAQAREVKSCSAETSP